MIRDVVRDVGDRAVPMRRLHERFLLQADDLAPELRVFIGDRILPEGSGLPFR
jgi:hypothetical protein